MQPTTEPREGDAAAVEELERIKKTQNLHTKVTIGAAVAASNMSYADGHSRKSINEADTAVDGFVQSLLEKERTKLGQVQAGNIDEWVDAAQCQGHHAEASPVTKRKLRAYVSTIFTWAVKKYELHESPLKRVQKIAGVSSNPENIVAIRRLADLKKFIAGLEKYPYWQALAGTSVFAGSHWVEMFWLKIDDVYLDENYLRITSRSSGKRFTGTKTGRERNIAIEQTTLRAILERHVATRKAEQKRKDATVAEKSEWLFPSTVPENEFKKRTNSEPGQWSDNGVFADALVAVVEQVRAECARQAQEGAGFAGVDGVLVIRPEGMAAYLLHNLRALRMDLSGNRPRYGQQQRSS